MPAYRYRIDDWQFFGLYLGLIAVTAGVAYVVLGAVDRSVMALPPASLVLGVATGGALLGMAYVETLENWYEPYGVGVMVFLALGLVWLTSRAFFVGFAIGQVVGLVVTLMIGEVSRAVRSSR
ncbi:hypothetical protein SVXHr_0109 [Halorhabdus sp. SVX81]|uniref:hypothetical protein n=1 Tax=Halorhabdus sp. SVX81 TaxID=2978283 RepID=UPI0023D9DAA9|nr:hypothetical protein [Halorhabdus sp. SVX81]WEL16294.1 hypothetical protein SVXHr_0109 [Halorhabdus sp. SVX81]